MLYAGNAQDICKYRLMGYAMVAAMALLMAVGSSAYAQTQSASPSTHLRLEVAGYRAYEAHEANGDYYFTGSAELEIPVVKHAALGLRVLPLLLYPEGADSATVCGLGAGATGRLYQNSDNSGFFAEVGAAALWRVRDFRLDDSKFDFLTDCGVGYKFPNSGWHLAVRGQHISKSGWGCSDDGINGLGLAAGYSF